jgi:hypothetical protein
VATVPGERVTTILYLEEGLSLMIDYLPGEKGDYHTVRVPLISYDRLLPGERVTIIL